MILALSGINGRLAVEGFRELEKRTGRPRYIWPRAAGTPASPTPTPGPAGAGDHQPRWSGSETGGRRYAPFT